MISRFFSQGKRRFEDLSEQEILALAISSEEDDARIYLAYADGLQAEYPDSASTQSSAESPPPAMTMRLPR